MPVPKTISNDRFIHITLKSGGVAVLHEVQLEGKALEEVFRELLASRETGAFYTHDNFHIDTGQVACMIMDRRNYIDYETN